jgi:hypothetical protein
MLIKAVVVQCAVCLDEITTTAVSIQKMNGFIDFGLEFKIVGNGSGDGCPSIAGTNYADTF